MPGSEHLSSLREGYLQLALTTKTPKSGDYEQEYNGTGTDALVEIAYTDDRYSYSASFQHGTLGEMAFTVINEMRAPSDPNYGKVTPCTRYESRELPAGPVAKQARELYLAYTETT